MHIMQWAVGEQQKWLSKVPAKPARPQSASWTAMRDYVFKMFDVLLEAA
jgi:hypothetical protein